MIFVRNALEAVPVVTPNKSAQKLPKVSSANHQKSNKHIGDMSIEEINEIIDQRVLKEVKKREEDILQKVQTMLSSQPSKLRSSSDSASPTKQRKTEPSQFNPTKLPMISRSADSKYKTPHQTDEDAFRPKSGPEGILIPNNPSPIRNLEFHPKKLKLTSLKSPTPVKQRNSDSDWNSPFSQPVSNDAQDDSSIGKNSVTDNESAIGTLSLSYVHGYDGDFTRNGGTKASGKNVFWLSEEIIIYPAATLVILLNTQSGKQHYYRSHTEEVSALTIHNTLHLVASGQMGKDSRILIWDPRPILQNGPNGSPKGRQKFSPRDPPIDPSLQYHREIFLGAKTRGAMGLNFSPDGVLLVALGLEETKPIFIYDWSKNECLASVKLGHIDLYQIGFNPYLYVPPAKSHVSDVSASGDEGDVNSTRINPTKVPLEDNICCYSLISTMTRGVKFWTLRSIKERNDVVALASNGSQFKGRKIAIPKNKQSWSWKYVLEGNIGVFPKKSNHTPPDMTCYSILPEESEPGKLPKSKILTGGSNGSVYIWQQLEAGVEDTSREDYVPQFWFPRGRLLCVITGVHEGSLLDIDTYLTPSSINQQIKYLVATCGKDGVLNLWELDGKPATSDVLPMEHVTAINVSSHSTIIGSPRSAQWCFDGHHLIVGTTGNSLCLVRNHGPSTTASPAATHSLTDQQSSTQFNDLRLDIVISGHVGRINRVVPHPLHELYATVGVDKSVRLWSTKWSKQVAFTRVASNPTCAAFLPDGSGIAVGTEVGEVLILTCTYLQKLLENGEESKPNRKRVKWELLGKKFIGSKSKGKDGNVQAPTGGGGAGGPKQKNQIQSFEITEIKYSPDGEILAVATRDKFIHFLSAKVS